MTSTVRQDLVEARAAKSLVEMGHSVSNMRTALHSNKSSFSKKTLKTKGMKEFCAVSYDSYENGRGFALRSTLVLPEGGWATAVSCTVGSSMLIWR